MSLRSDPSTFNFQLSTLNPIISHIRIYPIKSLDGIELRSVEVGIRSLLHDREFAMLAEDGRFVNGKRTGKVNQLKASYDLSDYRVSFSERDKGEETSFHLINDKEKIETWLSDFFGLKISFLHNREGRLMDIPDRSCVTILSTGSLEYLSENITGHSVDDLRLRFRASLEIAGVPPFWEEKLADSDGEPIRYRVGDVRASGISIRARCNVPPQDPFTGELDKTFIKKMIVARDKNVPEWSMVRELHSLYHLSIDCFIPDSEKGKFINVGDEVEIL